MAVAEATLMSVVPKSGLVYPNIHIGGTNGRRLEGWGVSASLAADAVLSLMWLIPNPLPSGTCKLKLVRVANASTGDAIVNPAWASVAIGENYDTITLTAEGDNTISWATGDEDDLEETKITLDADTPVAGEFLVMELTFESTSWTLAQRSTWFPMVIWE